MTETVAGHAGPTGRTAARGAAAGTAGRWDRLVDHSWLLLEDVLFCVAGSLHTTDEVTGCAYWIKAPLAERLRRQVPGAIRSMPGVGPGVQLRWRGDTYVKLPALAPSPAWPAVHAALAGAGVRPVESSILAVAQLSAAHGMLDPRDALREAAALPGHVHHCGLRVLHRLLAAVGDPDGTTGLLGLTGSAAFDPGRLCHGPGSNSRPVAGTGTDVRADHDVDLLIYASAGPAQFLPAEVLVQAGITELGGIRLAELATADPRRAAYGGSRLFPAGRAGQHRDRLWARRRDVAWVDGVRLDQTLVPSDAQLVDQIPYAAAVRRPLTGLLRVHSVAPGYPTRLTAVADGRPVEIWVTARGFDGALQPGDDIRLAGAARRIDGASTSTGPPAGAVVTVDDVASHHLQLEA